MAAPTPTSPTPSAPLHSLGHAVLAQVRSELRKTYSTRLWWALLIPAALLNLLVNLVTAQGNTLAFTPALGMAVGLGSFSSKLAVIYGVVCATAEYRHRTISTSFLAEPRRPLLIGAKALVAAIVGALYGVVSALAGVLGILFAGGLGDAPVDTLLSVIAGATVVFALWAALGVGVGTLLNNQLAAIVTVLLYLMLVEQIAAGVSSLFGFGQVEEYLPGGSANTVLTDLANAGSLSTLLGAGTQPWWLALLIFAGYAAVAVLAGTATAQRRDIT